MVLQQVRDDVWLLAQPMPGGHIESSNVVVLRDSRGGVHLVDSGWDSDENWAALVGALETLGADASRIRSVTATHLHPDHLGLAERVRAASGAAIAVHRLERDALETMTSGSLTIESLTRQLDEWGVPADRRAEFEAILFRRVTQSAVEVDRLLDDGEVLDIPGFALTVMHTPGHTPGHLCLRDDDRGFIITGDTVLPTMHAGLALGGPTATNALGDYLASLDRLSLVDLEVLPGHGEPFRGLPARAAEHAEHHLRRSREVAAVLAEGGNPSVWEIASRLTWTAGWSNLQSFFLYSALSQTELHREYLQG